MARTMARLQLLTDHSNKNGSIISIDSPPVSPEHYIHSRLKNSLASGIKEIPYTGISEGDSLRRVASLNAEVRNKIFYSSVPQQPRVNGHQERLSYSDIQSHYKEKRYRSISPISTSSTNTNHLVRDVNSADPPSPPTKHYTIKNSSVIVVDVMKNRAHKPKRLSKTTTKKVSPQLGYVRRLAAVNARACLSAIMKSEVKSNDENMDESALVDCKDNAPLLSHSAVSRQPSILGAKRKFSPLYNCNGNNSKKKKGGEEKTKVPPLSALASLQHSAQASTETGSSEDSEPEFNKLGLLYNSDCIHPSVRLYLNNEGKTPQDLIIPKVVPKTNLQSIIQRECTVNTKYKALKVRN